MRAAVFLKKELFEIVRTWKIIVLPALFLFFGFLSPITARYIKEIIMSTGVEFDFSFIPDPRFTDSYVQFFKNMYQIGGIILVLVFSGSVVGEKVSGSAAIVLTKRLSRASFVLSKFIAGALLFTLSYLLSLAASLYYTLILFSSFYVDGIWAPFLLYWLYGLFLIAMAILAGTVSRSHMFANLIAFGGFALSSLVKYIPKVGDYTTGVFHQLGLDVIYGNRQALDITYPAAGALVTMAVLLAAAVLVFRKQEL